MNKIEEICQKYKVDLCYIFGSQKEIGMALLNGDQENKEAYEEKVMMFAADELEIFKLNDRDFLEAIDNGYFEFEYQADRR